MATGGTVNEIFTLDDEDLDEFRINYTKYLRRFECPWKIWKAPSTSDLLKWKFLKTNNSNIPEKEELDQLLPILDIQKEKLMSPPEDKIQVTWIGHATLLVQFDGITILTDPVFRDYCGPKVPGIPLGFKRYRKAACQVDDFQHIDAVIVSHDHFDHLDWQSAGEISKKFPDVKWFVGKNCRDLCQMKKEENITDLLWWQGKTIEIKGKRFMFACTPAQHWCRRSAFDVNKRLWCSWVVKGPTKSFFFAGDTGYYKPVFEKIGEKYGPFSLSALPIGCSEPRSILEYQHVCPAEASKIHYDVKSESSVSMHWGTFKTMALEFYLDPPHLLEACMGQDKDKFISLQHGETWVVGSHRERPRFMDAKPCSKGNSRNSVEDRGESRTKTCPEPENRIIVENRGESGTIACSEEKNQIIVEETISENSEKAPERENSEIAEETKNREIAKETENTEKTKEGENSEKAKEMENSEEAKERENGDKAKESSEKAKESEYNKKTQESEDREKAKESENRQKAKESENSEKAKEQENREKAKESANSEKAKERENSEIAKEIGNSENAKESEYCKKAMESEDREKTKESENSEKANTSENSEEANANEKSEKADASENSENANEKENSEKANASVSSENSEKAKKSENGEKAKEGESSEKAKESENSEKEKESEKAEKEN